MEQAMEEILDLYDKNRILTNQTIVRGKPMPANHYRMLVHVCLFNSNGKLLIQQRQANRKRWAGLWDVSVGGAAMQGESSEDAATRELQEELGIAHNFANERPFFTINAKTGFDDFYLIYKDVDLASLTLQPEEVQAAKWASKDEVLCMIDDGTFIAYYKGFIELIFDMRKRGLHQKQVDPD